MKRAILALVALVVVAAPFFLLAQERGAMAIRNDGSDIRRVLVIGAHPDDEDTQLISWLQRSGRAETAYLSLTRGDGGQNLIGNELGEALGVIRTEELLAARRVDGAHQYFTRAYDFGYSKSAAETYAHWPRDSLLNDVVTVVRAFRPHVIVAVFSGTPRDGHGQHQVSGILSKEAYDAAGDVSRFPEAKFGPAWTPLKFYRGARFSPATATLRFNVGEYNPELGRSYAEIAGESRSQHKSQGFGALQRKGVIWNFARREATRVNQAAPAETEKSIFDGVDARAPFIPDKVYRDLDRSIALEAIADRQYLALGDSALVVVTLYNRSGKPVYMRRGGTPVTVAADSAFRWNTYVRGNEITQPWWLKSARNGDLFSPSLPVASVDLVGRPWQAWLTTAEDQRDKPGLLKVSYWTDRGDDVLFGKEAPIVYRYADPVRGDVQTPLAVMPAVSVTLEHANELVRANASLDRFFNVTLRSALMKGVPATVSLVLPRGLSTDSASRTLGIDSAGTRTVTFRVRGRLSPGVHEISAHAAVLGTSYSRGFVPIDYEHIAPERMYRPATVALHAVAITIPPKLNVAYVRGVGDNVEPALEQLGIPVTVIDPRAIPTVDLARFTAVVVGPRAYQASRDLVDNNPYLLNYAKSGGTLVVQYGQYEMMRPGTMPYAISIAQPHDRVTEETAPITILDPSSSVLRRPNVIRSSDFDGWIQERALYMPRTFDQKYHPIVALNDPGEPVNNGGIIVAPYGKGVYVYTTLAFFRQLPAGVSGAARLFVNLLAVRPGDLASPRAIGGSE